MSKIKIKQISSDGQLEGAVLTTDGNGNNAWVVPTPAEGSNTLLGDAEDGSYTDPRYTGGKAPAVGLQPTTKVSSAIDSINEVLGLLLPTAPAAISTGVLTLSTVNTTAKAAQGYTANSLTSAPAAGSNVARITATAATTAVLQDLGDGMDGTIALYVNDAAAAGETLAFTGDVGDAKTTGVLRITDNKWGGTAVGGGAAPDGFFQTFDSQVVGAAATVGLNHIQLQHTLSGNTNVLSFVRDDLTANPVVSNVVVVEGTKTGVKSSGVEHYGAGSTLNVTGNATNLAGQTYATGTILSIAGPGTTLNFAAGQANLPAILNVNTLNFAMTSQAFTVGGNVQTRTGNISLSATNPNGTGTSTSTGNLLVLSGTGSIADASVTGPTGSNGNGTAARVYFAGTGDTPSALTSAAWASTQDLSAAGYKHEAAIVGGVLRSDQTNYSTGYLPAGNPDYSGKDTAQYVTYSIKVGSKSSVSVTVTGSYAGVWVALPGVSNNATTSPAALGGAWWDGKALYNGAGVPGRAGDTTAGCAAGTLPAGTGTQTFTLTFGTASSSQATNNEVLVRFKLNAGQAITALSFA